MHLKKFQNSHDSFLNRIKKTPRTVKKILAVLCAAAVISSTVPFVAMNVNAQTPIYASTTEYLNLRKGAGMNYGVIKVIDKNEKVTVIDRANTNWLRVKLSDGTTGYCSSDYLDIKTDAKTTSYLNARKGAGTGYGIIKTLAPDTSLDILKFCGNSWAYVKLADGSKVYVCTDYTDFVNNATTASAYKETSPLQISESARTIEVGEDFTLTVTSGAVGNVNWSIADRTVASVSNKGHVTGLKEGTTKVTATDISTKKTAVCTVTVNKVGSKSSASIKLSDSSKSLLKGQTYTIKYTANPENMKVSFSSSDSAVAAVNSKGVVTAKADGTAKITVSDEAGTAKAVFTVTVRTASNSQQKSSSQTERTISISDTWAEMDVGNSYTISAKLSDGSAVNWSSSDTSVASVRNGVISGLKAGNAVITASDSTGKVTAKCNVTVNYLASNGVSVSRSFSSLSAGKTLYIKGYSSRNARWSTSDSNVATVSEGFILGVNPGKAAISYTDSYGYRAVCVVTVYDAEPIRFTYSSPNSATIGTTVKLNAITDKKRTRVRFIVNMNGKKTTVDATDLTEGNNTYYWTGYIKVTEAGTFTYEAQSYCNNQWKTCEDGKADIYVSSKTDKKQTSLDPLRASDEVIRFIGEKEGFVPSVVYDTLAYNVPTLGHGYVVWEGEKFYNNLTKNEGYALLVKAVNEGSYTSKVNNFLINNNIRFNQQQFDALVSFSYNLGTGWTSSSDLRGILLDSYGIVSDGTTVAGTVTASSGLNLRQGATTSSAVVTVLGYNEQVTLLSTQKINGVWYKVKTTSGKTGYCSGTYLRLSAGSAVARDLNYVNRNALINELLAYHHAAGVCYYGLLYRRADELEMFIYGDYATDGRSNKHGFPNPYCISFP